MSETINFPRDTTLQSVTAAIQEGNDIMSENLGAIAAIIAANGTYDFTDLNKIKTLVKLGIAEKVIPVGSQIIVPWTDRETGTKYDFVWDVVHYSKVVLKDGDIVNGMYLQAHYASTYGVMFDNYEAFYAAKTELPAGTYNIVMGTNWGKNVISGKSYQFTLSQAVPVGGQLSGFESCPDVAQSNWKVKSWKTSSDTSPIETVVVTEGSDGTNLGTLKTGGDGTLNCLQRTGYGYNRWAQSAIRQWLNSTGAINTWWTPQNIFDRYPNELLTHSGFLAGFEQDFLGALTQVKVTTALNTVTDSSAGLTEDTYDKIFLPALQQEYITPQLVDTEGETWEYWRKASGRTSYAPYSTALPEYVTYTLDSKTTPTYVRLRSASRGSASYPWIVYTTGVIFNSTAVYSYRCAPACVIV